LYPDAHPLGRTSRIDAKPDRGFGGQTGFATFASVAFGPAANRAFHFSKESNFGAPLFDAAKEESTRSRYGSEDNGAI
jgi:hypothetical protein